MTSQRKIAKAAGVIIAVGFISRIIGLLREIVIANQFGASAKTDAFVMSVNIPEIIMNLFAGGALVAAFLPIFSSLLAQSKEKEAWQVASGVLNLLLLTLGAFSALGIIFAPQLVYLFAPGFSSDPETFATTVLLTRITIPSMLFFGLATLFRGILHSYEKFALPAFAPLALNIWIIIGATILGSHFQKPVIGLAIGFILGSLTQAVMLLPEVIKRGKIFQGGLQLQNPELKNVGKLLLPLVFGEFFGRLYMIVDRVIASFLFPGSIAALNFANKLVKLPIRTIGGSASAAMFPIISKQVAVGDEDEFWRTAHMALRMILFITVPIMVWFVLFRMTIVKVVFQRGEFGEQDVILTSFVILFLGFEITAGSLGHVLNRIYFARKDTVTPIIANVISMIVKIALSIGLVWWWYFENRLLALAGLALATALCSWLKAGILFAYLIIRKNGFRFVKLIPTFIWSVTTSLLLFGVLYVGLEQSPGSMFSLRVSDVYQRFAISLFLGYGLYFYCSYLLKLDEARKLVSLLKIKGKK